MNNRYLTLKQVADYMGVTSRSMERWHAAGKIPKPHHVDDRGWKFWTPEQAKEILAWHLVTTRKPKKQIPAYQEQPEDRR